MFNKLKQFKDLHKQAKQLQSELSDVVMEESKNGVSLSIDGNLSLKSLTIDESMLDPKNKSKLESTIKDLHGEALKKIQRTMALKMKEMGGLPNIPGLS